MTEYRQSTPPDNDVKYCAHCATPYEDSGFRGYCSKNCYKYDVM